MATLLDSSVPDYKNALEYQLHVPAVALASKTVVSAQK